MRSGAPRRTSPPSGRRRPVEGAPATEQTEVHVAYDNERLYFGIYAHYADLGLRSSQPRRSRRHGQRRHRHVLHSIRFSINNARMSSRLTATAFSAMRSLCAGTAGDSSASGDASWNALFASAGQLVDDGWTAEMAIPFKSLRYPARGNGESAPVGVSGRREIQDEERDGAWSPISRDVLGFLRQMGVVDGITDLSTARNFELLPTVTAIATGNLNARPVSTRRRVHEAGHQSEVRHHIESRRSTSPTIPTSRKSNRTASRSKSTSASRPVPGAATVLSRGQRIYQVASPGGATSSTPTSWIRATAPS